MSAKQLADAQRRADAAHHQHRITWLEAKDPQWSCGAPVSNADKQQMLNSSRFFLNNPSAGFNHCNCTPRCSEDVV
ncbi:TPA: hypothetical protein I8273_004642 [Aeromonas hydrophila]|nr:hypothetical protein [Aeromonas hydrophila]HAT2639104.1 hypothetical protein [Aeromonas hydrophila]HAT3424268.1 hypothetical protein [Aeromonas hydrophila]HAT3534266.1 hypothetical protein [Aeromonas hydrophila]